jgi:hypothetical protein
MATQDDTLTGAVPDPDSEPTAAELAHARRFAELVDKALTGRPPPAISADDRALLEVATVIRATRGSAPLAESQQRIIVDDALRQAAGAASAAGVPGRARSSSAEPRSRSRSRLAPWLVTAATTLVAAAALAALWLRTPVPAPAHRAALPAEWTSRPADSLVGPIGRDHAGDASARIDAIFADRLDGFRGRRLAYGGKR